MLQTEQAVRTLVIFLHSTQTSSRTYPIFCPMGTAQPGRESNHSSQPLLAATNDAQKVLQHNFLLLLILYNFLNIHISWIHWCITRLIFVHNLHQLQQAWACEKQEHLTPSYLTYTLIISVLSHSHVGIPRTATWRQVTSLGWMS